MLEPMLLCCGAAGGAGSEEGGEAGCGGLRRG